MATLPYSFRMAGSNPSVVVDDSKVEYQLDPYSLNDRAAFVVRHACNVFFRVDALPDSLGGGASLATAVPGFFGASVEALRLTAQGGVRVPGSFQAGAYSNLAASFQDATSIRPPSARALNDAYYQLSNLITVRIAEAASAPGTLLAADAAADVLGPNGVVSGPVVCADLHVVDGGRVVATNYAGLPVDYASASTVMPPSAYALRRAVTDLSNWMVESAPSWWRTPTGGAPFATDAPLRSVDAQPRLSFAYNGATGFAAYAPSNGAALFEWANSSNGARAMALSGGGDLVLRGGLALMGASNHRVPVGVTSDGAYAAADASNVAASAALVSALLARVASLEAVVGTA